MTTSGTRLNHTRTCAAIDSAISAYIERRSVQPRGMEKLARTAGQWQTEKDTPPTSGGCHCAFSQALPRSTARTDMDQRRPSSVRARPRPRACASLAFTPPEPSPPSLPSASSSASPSRRGARPRTSRGTARRCRDTQGLRTGSPARCHLRA